MFQKVFPQAGVVDPTKQTETEGTGQEEVPRAEYDLLRHLDRTPARISILDLIKRSRIHQDILFSYLQKVMVNEDIVPEKITTALAPLSASPAIQFTRA